MRPKNASTNFSFTLSKWAEAFIMPLLRRRRFLSLWYTPVRAGNNFSGIRLRNNSWREYVDNVAEDRVEELSFSSKLERLSKHFIRLSVWIRKFWMLAHCTFYENSNLPAFSRIHGTPCRLLERVERRMKIFPTGKIFRMANIILWKEKIFTEWIRLDNLMMIFILLTTKCLKNLSLRFSHPFRITRKYL